MLSENSAISVSRRHAAKDGFSLKSPRGWSSCFYAFDVAPCRCCMGWDVHGVPGIQGALPA